ncbi:cytochrome b5-like heme/steroid binding domain-containing protein [Aspergillus homomorphus CBS 101889]|uniref:Cytochrome b5 n=1 Tax=Aspergillus homomorphus (strain CBS 101889) TaxID=1450537 RepID=A0A395I7U3_ASPHC|nr:cytochrome b5 [Aspergillus homomorphus CBS 101889]RAL16282.1 cytochrome b5 [Aspergillus homomorphus CBS 101889]
MSETKEFTLAEVTGHNTKKDLYMVIHDKVYDCSSFVDEHPPTPPPTNPPQTNSGGEEVLLDVAGQDGTEAFEDVGHSDEAREILDGLFVGNVKRMPGDPAPRAQSKPAASASSGDAAGMGVGLYAFLAVGGLIAYGAYQYLQKASLSAETQ